MDFIAHCFVIFFSLVGFAFIVFCAAMYCIDSVVATLDKEEDMDTVNQKFEKIVRH